MVAVVDSLEARGLVERRPHPSDRRARTLHITGEGQKVLENAREHAMALERTICAGFSTAQRQKLIDMLSDVSDNLGLVQGLHPGMAGHNDSPRGADDAPHDAGSSKRDA
jgi:DNA-binding MarR family transcriptional regulator